MTLKKIYKYGFWLLLLVTITLGNIMRITNIKCDERISYQSKIYTKRIISLLDDSFSKPKKIALVSGVDLYTYESYTDLFSTTTIAILLSDFDCSDCQEHELKKLNDMKRELEEFNIKICGITIADNRADVITQLKYLDFQLKVYIIDENVFFNTLSSTANFPQLIFVEDNKLYTSLSTIPRDLVYTDYFYKFIIQH